MNLGCGSFRAGAVAEHTHAVYYATMTAVVARINAWSGRAPL